MRNTLCRGESLTNASLLVDTGGKAKLVSGRNGLRGKRRDTRVRGIPKTRAAVRAWGFPGIALLNIQRWRRNQHFAV